MSRTVTALFDTRADADAGRARLLAANIDADNVRIHDQASSGAMDTSNSSGSQDSGMWGSIKNAFLPDEDRHTYEEGMRRGAFVLSADVDENEIDAAIRVLEETNSVDVDERSTSWKKEGWTPPAPMPMTTSKPDMFNDGRVGDDSIEVVEERLVVGKREVERGGVRVRSYVTEVPVHEQVRLRDEKVELQRRPVDREVSSMGGDAFQERSISMTETDEEAVVGKTARVVEEISLRKTANERVEDINETVRKTNVEVENLSDVDGTMSRDATTTGGTVGSTAAGMGKEALGNVKQGLGSLTGDESLKRSGEAQERAGEAQQGKPTDRNSY